MTTWATKIGALTLFVDDLPATKAFYRAVFDRPLVFEDEESSAFDFGSLVVNLLQASAAGELIAPAVVGGPGGGARMQLTVDVEDVDLTCGELRRRGVVLLNGPIDRPWGVRTAAFADPAGHVWEIASPLRKG